MLKLFTNVINVQDAKTSQKCHNIQAFETTQKCLNMHDVEITKLYVKSMYDVETIQICHNYV